MTGDPDKDGAHEMAQMDSDGNGKVVLAELKEFMRKNYYTNPEDIQDLQNDDGKPATPEDIEKMIQTDASELLEELDTDKSADLNLEEVVAQYRDIEGGEGMGDDEMPDDEMMDDVEPEEQSEEE